MERRSFLFYFFRGLISNGESSISASFGAAKLAVLAMDGIGSLSKVMTSKSDALVTLVDVSQAVEEVC